jgi:hypothetical protein
MAAGVLGRMSAGSQPPQPVPPRSRKREILIDLVGMTALVVLTLVLFERTQQTLMLLIGGVVLAVSVLGAFMLQ